MTIPNNCMMIDAVMYGMIPMAKIATLDRAPPANRLKKSKTPPVLNIAVMALTLTPGTGI